MLPSESKRKLKGTAPLSEEAAAALAGDINKSLVLIYPEARTERLYFDFFRSIEQRERGVISFDEFMEAVRLGLRCKIDDARLRAFWCLVFLCLSLTCASFRRGMIRC